MGDTGPVVSGVNYRRNNRSCETENPPPKPKMKTTINLFLASTILLFGGSIGKAQVIYSNSFSGGATTINGMPPTFASGFAGSPNYASWNCTYTNGPFTSLNGTVLASGAIGTNAGSVLLPFTPQNGAVYFLTASITLPASSPNWVGLGFAQSDTQGTNPTGERFTDGNVKGGPWMDVSAGKTSTFFGGPETSLGSASAMVEPTAGTYSLTIVLNTSKAQWTTAAYVNGTIQGTNVVGGTQLGTNIVYGTNPTIGYVGLTQQAIATNSGIQWNDFSLTLVPVSSYTATVSPASVISTNFEGWGTTLSWWANVVGGYSNRNEYVNLAFNQLGLNIVRYEIGAGQNPAIVITNPPYRAQMQGFEPSNGVWNWNADANQRWVLQAAEANGANLVEALSVSPPWWMCVNSNVDGNASGTNNLQVNCEDLFATYLATVISNLIVLDGDHFNYVTPMNEPSLGTGDDVDSGYEFCHMSNDQQQSVIADLRAQLNAFAPQTGIDASEDFDEYEAYVDLTSYSSATLGDLALFSTHTYEQNDAAGLEAEAAAQNKPLWVTEYSDTDTTGMTMAQHIHDDLTTTGARAWVYWQFTDSDIGKGFLYNPLVASTTPGYTTSYIFNPKFYIMAQFSEFIRPGCEIITVNDNNTLAAYTPTNSTLVLVTINTNASMFNVTYNLNSFGSKKWYVVVTQSGVGEKLGSVLNQGVANGQLTATIPATSVTTFVLTTNLPSAGLTISSLNGGAAELNWNYGVLQTATNVSGPYSDLTNVTPPFMATFTNGQQFFRIKEN